MADANTIFLKFFFSIKNTRDRVQYNKSRGGPRPAITRYSMIDEKNTEREFYENKGNESAETVTFCGSREYRRRTIMKSYVFTT